MKHMTNFRLSNQAITTLSLLEKKLHTSKTAIVEKALQFYARKGQAEQNTLLSFAGILNEQEATAMLEVIESSKHNKDIEVDL